MACNCGKKKYEVVTAAMAEQQRLDSIEQRRRQEEASKMQRLRDAESMRQASINAGRST